MEYFNRDKLRELAEEEFSKPSGSYNPNGLEGLIPVDKNNFRIYLTILKKNNIITIEEFILRAYNMGFRGKDLIPK